MWPKMEWRQAAMVLSMLGRFVLSATALLVMKSFHLMPRIRLWHVMWNACNLRESSFNSVQGVRTAGIKGLGLNITHGDGCG